MPTAKDLPTSKPDIAGLLTDINDHLSYALKKLVSQKSGLRAALQDETELPSPEVVGSAAKAIDLSNQIQQMLDPPVLILADHFFGKPSPSPEREVGSGT